MYIYCYIGVIWWLSRYTMTLVSATSFLYSALLAL